ncbi:NUDIX hydrolase [Bacillus horti]|uniref:8-oxo-dGTP diphosphatase n=1 Tax=Caldalkalibacillus horti TaxID=77523 RepID=A0ABT9VXE9_9BACI|nr:8-oxo-dGTP diphosphatase [Bacillus horti]MDQ0165666.1 8-oxo-dGTP diphosphatase [Bacillus horti]
MKEDQVIYTLCFIRKGTEILMLYRNHPPNAKQWNGVGGKIEHGETPKQAIQREILEETGLDVENLEYRGLVTWNEEGGTHVYLANAYNDSFVQTDEGYLAWKPLEWVLESPQVVSNIPLFLPDMLNDKLSAKEHAFTYEQEELVGYKVVDLPDHWRM